MEVKENIIKYLKNKIPTFIIDRRGKTDLFTCPKCKEYSSNFIKNTNTVICLACGFKGGIEDIIKVVEPDKDVDDVLVNELGIGDFNEELAIEEALVFYKNNSFDLVPVANNGKAPIECYDDQTEILTDNGWKFFKDLSSADLVASLKDNNIIFEKPSRIINETYNGQMLHLSHRGLDLCVTHNHKILYNDIDKAVRLAGSKPKLSYFSEIKSNDFAIPLVEGKWIGENEDYFVLNELPTAGGRQYPERKIKIDDWLNFLGWYISEGSLSISDSGYSIMIAQKTEDYIPLIVDAIKNIGFKPFICKTGISFYSKQVCLYLKQFKTSHFKYIPKSIKNLPVDQLRILMRSLMMGDGHYGEDYSFYTTASKQLADDVNEILLKIGIASSIHKKSKVVGEKTFFWYVVTLKQRDHVCFNKRNVKVVEYNSTIHCVTVSSGIVYVRRNGKSCWCGNCNWTSQNHTEIEEWKRWLSIDLNFGVKTGKISNVIALDFDTKEIPEEIKKMLGKTLVQETTRGYHYFFKYIGTLRKSRVDELKLDIETDGGQVVIYPSKVGEFKRKIHFDNIAEFPKELESYLIARGAKKVQESKLESGFSEFTVDGNIEDSAPVEFTMIKEGGRNQTLLSLGGQLRKSFSSNQTEVILNLINNNFVSPRMDARELREIIRSLGKYSNLDNQMMAKKVYEYLKLVEECNANDIKQALEETKKDIDNSLAFLVRENYAYRKGRNYYPIRKVEWDVGLTNIAKPINFKMPYFDDVANFNWGDIILLGAATKSGKTVSAINIIVELVEQGIKPYYVYLEGGSRFGNHALVMGLKEGDFYHKFAIDPLTVEIEPSSVVIIDWLMCENKAETDLIFRKLVEKAQKAGSIIIVYMQVKSNGEFFAPNLADLFVSFAAKYFYEEESNGARGYWHCKPIRDAKQRNTKECKLPCKYNWDTRRLTRVENLPEEVSIPKPVINKQPKPDSECDLFVNAKVVTL